MVAQYAIFGSTSLPLDSRRVSRLGLITEIDIICLCARVSVLHRERAESWYQRFLLGRDCSWASVIFGQDMTQNNGCRWTYP